VPGLAASGASGALTLSATVLANGAPRSPTEDFAHISCQRAEPTENSGKYLVALRVALLPPSAFSKVADWLAFRNAAI
jgi:hypothetical protein